MSNHIGPVIRVVVCAAIKHRLTDDIIIGIRHMDGQMFRALERYSRSESNYFTEQGFIDQHGEFMDRREALSVAEAAGQINTRRKKTEPLDELFSEDLY